MQKITTSQHLERNRYFKESALPRSMMAVMLLWCKCLNNMTVPVQWHSWWHLQKNCYMKNEAYKWQIKDLWLKQCISCLYCADPDLNHKTFVQVTSPTYRICSSMSIIILRFVASFDNRNNVYMPSWMFASIFCLCNYASFSMLFIPSVYCFRIMVIRKVRLLFLSQMKKKVRLLFLSQMKDHNTCMLWCVWIIASSNNICKPIIYIW